jgi:uncharacterized Zn finger protein (UPF0148 family)
MTNQTPNQTLNHGPLFESKGFVYCPICTHTVEGAVVSNRKGAKVKAGQKCSRCSASLDAGYIMRIERAAA